MKKIPINDITVDDLHLLTKDDIEYVIARLRLELQRRKWYKIKK